MAIQPTLQALASKFADDVMSAIRSAPVSELLGEEAPARPRTHATNGVSAKKPAAKAKPVEANGRLARRGPEEIEKTVGSILGLLAKNPAGMRSEQIRAALSMEAKEMPRPLAAAIESKRVTTKGQKRATTYFLKGASAGKKTTSKAAKTSKAKPSKAKGKK